MVEPSSRLPARPSLEQLRKQAKERLRQRRLTEADATLASVQFALAREYGFESWPKLVEHIGKLSPDRIEEFEQIAGNFLAGVRGDPDALDRIIQHTGASYNHEQIRIRIEWWLSDVAGADKAPNWTLDDARLTVARQYGFGTWDELAASLRNKAQAARGTGTPPFYWINRGRQIIELRPPMTDQDWEVIAEVIEDEGITGVIANGQMTDRGLERLSQVEQLIELNMDGSNRVSDDGLQQLARMPQLEKLDLSGWHMRFTDRGLEPLRQLHALREFKACWPQRITDAGVAGLAGCLNLQEVNLMGTHTGDGAIAVLAGKPELQRISCGRQLTDAGIKHLHRIPSFKVWRGQPAEYGLMGFASGPTHVLLDGPITDNGIRGLAGLDGMSGLNFFWHVSNLTPEGMAGLAALPRLAMVGCGGELCTDVAMKHLGQLPGLKMLQAQGTVAGDEGFIALSRSKTLEHIWGRESYNLGDRGLMALAKMETMQGLALSLQKVSQSALGALPEMARLSALVPMDVQDAAFEQVGRCAGLERLWCMYCRDTSDRATEQLAGLTRLRYYYAGKTQITDRSLEVLGQIESLEELEFWQIARITNAGLTALARLPRLRKLSLDSAGITREGLKVFPAGVEVSYHS